MHFFKQRKKLSHIFGKFAKYDPKSSIKILIIQSWILELGTSKLKII